MKIKISLSVCVGIILGAILMYFALDTGLVDDVFYPEFLKVTGCKPIENFYHIDKEAGVEVFGRMIECNLRRFK